MFMKYLILTTLFALTLSPMVHASVMEPDYNSEKDTALTPVYGYVGHGQLAADMGFIEGMKPHHEGALTMSEDYLESGKARNKALKSLAGGIIHNQKFEIYMLASVKRRLEQFHPHHGVKDYGVVAVRGLAQHNQYRRAPMPVLSDLDNVSAEDVRFAKAMIVHHEGAVTMAKDYLANPDADNAYLRALCFDVLRDQPAEIAFMGKIIKAYKGDASSIKIDPSMVHGMEGMKHGGNAHAGHH